MMLSVGQGIETTVLYPDIEPYNHDMLDVGDENLRLTPGVRLLGSE